MGATGTRIGIFGGTFDPIHSAHLEVADAVRRDLGLDRMLLVVANQPWQKEGDRTLTRAEDRFAMVEAAVAGRPGLEPSRMEIDRGGPSYTVDTVRQLKRDDPDAELFVVVGSDVVGRAHHVAERAHPAPRGHSGRRGPARRPTGAPSAGVAGGDGAGGALRCLEHRVASRLESGLSVDGLVPEAVIRCIEQRGLYATGR